jgi:nucleoside-diphosphate-sugar epimerase
VKKIRPEALVIFRNALQPSDRILISGGSGWFGNTAIAMTKTANLPYMVTGSTARNLILDGDKEKIESHHIAKIAAFKPTVVIDAAFLTREKVAVLGPDKYVEINRSLIKISLEMAGLSSVRKYVGFSSGAAFHLAGQNSFSLADNPYAALKRSYEEQMLEIDHSLGAEISIPRVFSVTGAYVSKPELFAFSNLIIQARSGVMEIHSKNKIFRRYSPVEDIIALAVAQAKQENGVIFDTGGEMLEIGELANQIKRELYPDALIRRELSPSLPVDDYQSDNTQWSRIASLHGLDQASISEQIMAASDSGLPAI